MIRVVVDFLWIAVLLSILLGLLATVVPILGQSSGLISIIAGAMGAGQFYARRTGNVASKGFAWKTALMITAVVMFLTMALVEWRRSSGGFPELNEISVGAYALGMVVAGAIMLLVVRFCFRWGTKLGGPGA